MIPTSDENKKVTRRGRPRTTSTRGATTTTWPFLANVTKLGVTGLIKESKSLVPKQRLAYNFAVSGDKTLGALDSILKILK